MEIVWLHVFIHPTRPVERLPLEGLTRPMLRGLICEFPLNFRNAEAKLRWGLLVDVDNERARNAEQKPKQVEWKPGKGNLIWLWSLPNRIISYHIWGIGPPNRRATLCVTPGALKCYQTRRSNWKTRETLYGMFPSSGSRSTFLLSFTSAPSATAEPYTL